MKIESKRLILRDWQDKDVNDLVEGLNNIEVSKWMAGVPFPYTENDARNFIKWAKKYDKSIISQFVNYLANKSDIKKKILAFAFCYDLPFLIYIISPEIDCFCIGSIVSIIGLYTIFYVGGIFLFYLMLYKEIEKNKM